MVKRITKNRILILTAAAVIFLCLVTVMTFGSGSLSADAANPRSVTFVMNGGLLNNSNESLTYTVEYGDVVTPPADPVYSSDNYAFNGWYTGADNGDNNYTLYNEYDFNTPVTTNFSLYAAWEPTVFTVTFKSEGVTKATFYNVPAGATLETAFDANGSPSGFYLYLNGTPVYDTRTIYANNNGLIEVPQSTQAGTTMLFVQWAADTAVGDDNGMTIFADTNFYATYAAGDVYIVSSSFETNSGGIVAMTTAEIHSYLENNDHVSFNLNMKVPTVVGYSATELAYTPIFTLTAEEIAALPTISNVAVLDEDGNPVLDENNNPTYEQRIVLNNVNDATVQLLCKAGFIPCRYEEVDIVNELNEVIGTEIVFTPTKDSAGYAFIHFDVRYAFVSGTPFRIQYYYENANDSNYATGSLIRLKTAEATGNRVDLTELTYNGSPVLAAPDGYTLSAASASSTEYLIDGDGQMVINVYFNRNTYDIYYNTSGGSYIAPNTLKFGQVIPVVAAPVRSGYTMERWYYYNSAGIEISVTPGSTQMGADSITAIVRWLDDVTTYTISYYLENPDDDNYSTVGTLTVNSATGATVLLSNIQNQISTGFNNIMGTEAVYFTYDGTQTAAGMLSGDNGAYAIVAGDASTNINAYYTRNVYTIFFQLGSYSNGYRFYTSGTSTSAVPSNVEISLEKTSQNGVKTKNYINSTTNQTDMYSITAKYNANIAEYWPMPSEVSPSSFISGNSNYYPYGWYNSLESTTQVTGVFTMNSDFISNTTSTPLTIVTATGRVDLGVHNVSGSLTRTSSSRASLTARVYINGTQYSATANSSSRSSDGSYSDTVNVTATIDGRTVIVPVAITYTRSGSGATFTYNMSSITASGITVDGSCMFYTSVVDYDVPSAPTVTASSASGSVTSSFGGGNTATITATAVINGVSFSASTTRSSVNSSSSYTDTINVIGSYQGFAVTVPVTVNYTVSSSGWFQYTVNVNSTTVGSVTLNPIYGYDGYVIIPTETTTTTAYTTVRLEWTRSSTQYTAYYYFENIDQTSQTGTYYNGTYYTVDDRYTITGSFSSLNPKEITGFTSVNVVSGNNNTIHLYYKRIRYTLNYYNGNAIAYTRTVLFGESLSGYSSPQTGDTSFEYYVATAGTKDWSFSGWYTDAYCTNSVDWTNTVSDTDITVYAGWTAPNYKVSYNINGGSFTNAATTALGSYALYNDGTYRKSFAEGSVVSEDLYNDADTTMMERTGYTFDYWYFLNGTSEVRYQFLASQYIYDDLALYAKWTPDNRSCYKVYYLTDTIMQTYLGEMVKDANGNYIMVTYNGVSYYQLAVPKEEGGLTYGSSVSEEALTFSGYLPNYSTQTMVFDGAETLTVDGVDYPIDYMYFVYLNFNEVTYYIHYVEWNGTDYGTSVPPDGLGFIATTETVILQSGDTAMNVTVRAKTVVGYTVRGSSQKTFTLSSDDTQNHFYFYYLGNTAKVDFTVNYYIMSAAGAYPDSENGPSYSFIGQAALGSYLYADAFESESSYANYLTAADVITLRAPIAGHTLDVASSDVFMIITGGNENLTAAQANVINIYMMNGTFRIDYNLNASKNFPAVWNDLSRTESETSSDILYIVGTVNDLYYQTFIYPTLATRPVDPTRNGYTFVGWGTTATSTTADFDFTTPISEDTMVYAVWLEWHTVMFYLRGGTWTDTGNTYVLYDGEDIAVKNVPGYYALVADNGTFNAPTNPYKNDGSTKYTLKGWSLDDPDSVANPTLFTAFGSTAVTDDVYLYAVWEQTTAEVFVKNVDSNDNTLNLSGAEFVLRKVIYSTTGAYTDNSGNRFDYDTTFSAMTVTTGTSGSGNAYYDTTDHQIVFDYLQAGTYVLIQNSAQRAASVNDRTYSPITAGVYFTLTVSNGTATVTTTSVATADNSYVSASGDVITVKNKGVASHKLSITYTLYKANVLQSTSTTDVGYFSEDESYSVTLNTSSFTGYAVTQNDSLTGTMGTSDIVINVRLDAVELTLTIYYKYRVSGSTAATTYTLNPLYYGDTYSVTSPVITNYQADVVVASGTMGTTDRSVTVYYSLVALKVDYGKEFTTSDFTVISDIQIAQNGVFSIYVDYAPVLTATDRFVFPSTNKVPENTMFTLVVIPTTGANANIPSYYYYVTTENDDGVAFSEFKAMGTDTLITFDGESANVILVMDFAFAATTAGSNTITFRYQRGFQYIQNYTLLASESEINASVLAGQDAANSTVSASDGLDNCGTLTAIAKVYDSTDTQIYIPAGTSLSISGTAASFAAKHFFYSFANASALENADGNIALTFTTDNFRLIPDTYTVILTVYAESGNMLQKISYEITVEEPCATSVTVTTAQPSIVITAGESINATLAELSNGTTTSQYITATYYAADGTTTELGTNYSSYLTVTNNAGAITVTASQTASEGIYRVTFHCDATDSDGATYTSLDYIEYIIIE